MSKTIGVILSLKNTLSEQIKPAIASLKEAEKQSEQAKEQLEVYKQAVEQAKANIAQYVTELENLKKSVVEQNREYQQAKANIDSLKNSNIELQAEISRQAMELDKLGQEYRSTSTEYKNAAKQLQALRQQYRNNNTSIKEQTENLDRLEETIIQNSDAVNDMKAQEKALKEALEQAEQAANEQRKEILKLGNSFKQIEKEVEESKKTFKEWSRTVGSSIDEAVKSALKWGASIIGLTGGLGAGGAIKMGMETSINLEAYRTMLDTATKNFEKTNKLMRNAEKLSISTPFNPEEVIQATATLESYGIDSERWLSLIADAAGATNTTMEQATEAVKDILSKNEFETMENLGISKEMIIAAAEKKYGKNKVFNKQGQVKDKQEEKLKIVLEEIMVSKFDGGAEKLSQTVKGLWSTITGSINMGLAKILGMENGLIKTGSILDIIKNKMQLISEVLLKWESEGTLDRVAKEVTVVFTEITNSVMNAYNFIKENHEVILALTKFLGIIYVLTKGFFALKAAFEAYQIAVTALSSIGFLVSIFSKLKLAIIGVNLALTATPVGFILKVIALVILGIGFLIQNFETIKKVATNFFNSFDSWFEKMPFLIKLLASPFKIIIESIKLVVKTLEGAGKVFNFFKDTISFLFGSEEGKKEIEVIETTEKDLKENVQQNVLTNMEKKSQSPYNFNKKFEQKIEKESIPISLNKTKANAINNANVTKAIQPTLRPIQVYIQGDIYGYDEFDEKVAGVLVNIIKNKMANVT